MREKIFCLFFCFLVSSFAFSASQKPEAEFVSLKKFNIWSGIEKPVNESVYMTAFLPSSEKANGTAAVIFPGGSYVYMGIVKEGYEVAKFLAQNGTAGFVVNYRTAMTWNHHPAMIEDAQRSIQIIKENAEKYGVAADKVGVIGFSAGGHLAGVAAEYFDTNFLEALGIEVKCDLKPAFCTMVYPVVTMTEPYVHKRSRKNLLGSAWQQGEMQEMMSLEKNVRADMPPVFLVQCTKDKTVDFHNAVMLAEALTSKYVEHKFLLFEEEGHGFGLNEKKYPGNKAWTWRDDFLGWLAEIGLVK